LIAAVATFAASWRFSNCTIRDVNHRKKETVKTKVEKIRTEADLKLIVLSSCLGVTVFGRPPFLEEAPSVVAIVGVGGVRRRVQYEDGSRLSIGGGGGSMLF